ncbi:MATE family efflux transporter, partial [Gallintestinimicrobium sp.]|uniref:MATE family efflux transporter n=1 Tax=Gallintestinimicrobium sp. TaxID=2981655 RepID=UPI0039959FF6
MEIYSSSYSLVDTAIVGKFPGVDQLAAVGSTGSINFLIIGFCMGICSGFAIPIAQRFGAKDESGMRRCVANSAWVSVIFAVVLTIVTVLLCRNILQWMRTPENIIDDAWMYIVIIFAGIPVTILYNLTSAIIRAMGDSKTPVYFLVMSALLNIVLDLFCILVLKMGVAGAALATVISQAISGICCLVYMIRKYEILRMQGTEGKADPELMLRLAGMGVPMGLQYSVTAIGSVILQSAVNTLGSTAVAAVTASGRISGFFVCPSDALGATMATWAGQNMGAKKPKRIREGLWMANIYGIVYALIAFGILAAAGKYGAFVCGRDRPGADESDS